MFNACCAIFRWCYYIKILADGVDIFPTQTGPQFTVDMTQGGQHDFFDIDGFKYKIKQKMSL